MTRIKAVSLFLALCMGMGAALAENASKPVKFDFRSVSVAQVIQLIYADVLGTPYVLDPEVLTDARVVSFKYSGDKNEEVRLFVKTFLASLGYVAQHRDGVDVIAKRQDETKPEPAAELDGFVYRPRPIASGACDIALVKRRSSSRLPAGNDAD